MSDVQEARLRQLDLEADALGADSRQAADLFGIVELLESESALRRHLSDPSVPEPARRQLIEQVFAGKVSPGAVGVLAAASSLRWGEGLTLASALERQAVRAVMAEADAAGQLDELEQQLFGVLRTVRGSIDLSVALSDRSLPLDARRGLLRGLIQGKVLPSVDSLSERAVAARGRTFELTVEGYLVLAAAQRQRGIAQVTVARPLTETQFDRLRSALVAQSGRPLTLEVTVDPAVLGGVQVVIGSDVIQGTVASRLEAARRAFA